MSSCQIDMLPDKFYNKLEEGSIIVKRSPSFHFCREVLTVSGEDKPISSDLMILATGYKGDQKLKNIFRSSVFQEHLIPSPTSTIPLYRFDFILAVATPGDSSSDSPARKNRICGRPCKPADHGDQMPVARAPREGNIKLPSIKVMEEDTARWEIHMKQYCGKGFWRSCIGATNIWYSDQLCKDMNCNPRRKRGVFSRVVPTLWTN